MKTSRDFTGTMRYCAVLAAFIIFTFFAASTEAKDNTATATFNKGIESGSKGDFKKAAALFEKSLKQDPIFTPPRHVIKIARDAMAKKISAKTAQRIFTGVKLTNPKDAKKAIKEFNKAIKASPKYSDAYTLRAMAHALNNDLDKATSDLTNSITLTPGNVMAYYTRGSIYASNGIYKHALADLNKTIELAPNMVAAYNNRAGLYYGKGEFDLAIADLSHAIKLAPKNVLFYQSRGFLYIVRLSDNAKGCADWKTACDLGDCASLKMAQEKKLCK